LARQRQRLREIPVVLALQVARIAAVLFADLTIHAVDHQLAFFFARQLASAADRLALCLEAAPLLAIYLDCPSSGTTYTSATIPPSSWDRLPSQGRRNQWATNGIARTQDREFISSLSRPTRP
jgi:hypothetical protein